VTLISKFRDSHAMHCVEMTWNDLYQRCTTFLGQGPQCLVFNALEGRRQNYDLNFRKTSIENRNQKLFNLSFCCLYFDILAI